MKTYMLRAGDTLERVALRFFGSAIYKEHIIRSNRLQTDILHIGTIIKIEPVKYADSHRTAG